LASVGVVRSSLASKAWSDYVMSIASRHTEDKFMSHTHKKEDSPKERPEETALCGTKEAARKTV
jgi:hypothetical protein